MESDEIARPTTERRLARESLIVAAVALGVAAGLALAWVAASALLILFAGILFGVALDAGARSFGPVLRGYHKVRLGVVVLLFAAVVVGIAAWGGSTLVLQFGELSEIVSEQSERLMDTVSDLRSGGGGDGGESDDVANILPGMGAIAGGATNAIFSLFGALGNFFVVFFIGIFFAAQPELYKAGVLSLVPGPRRPRVGEVISRMGDALRGWLVGQSISMAVIFLLTWLLLTLIGMPYALLLGLQAGLLAFIPTIGPAVAGVVIVLAGLADGPTMALWAFGVYLLIQGVESNVLTPMVQERTTSMPPILSLGVQIVFWALFGLLGMALAVPLTAALKVLVAELYIKDVLGGGVEPSRLETETP
jgi:predicted PurR-regulated permease PerM